MKYPTDCELRQRTWFRAVVLALLAFLSFVLVRQTFAQSTAPPRCLPGASPNNFATDTDATGDTLAVLWCDDAQGIGVSVLGGALSTPTGACLAATQSLRATVASVGATCKISFCTRFISVLTASSDENSDSSAS